MNNQVMAKKDYRGEVEREEDENEDEDLDEIHHSVFRAILKNNRIMLRQNNRILEILEQEH